MKLWTTTPGLCEEIPQITYYGAKIKKTDAAVVIFPGGGYIMRADYEGRGYAEFLNEFGINAFVVDYRVSPHRFPLELLDARRGIRFVRYNAEKYGIDPNKIAVMGSSSGGHLAALVSTYMKPIDFENSDDIDKESYIPNAQILCYPVICSPREEKISHVNSYISLLGEENLNLSDEYSPDLIANESTPQAFIWHTAYDGIVSVINSYSYATALRKLSIPVEMHVFPNGLHGLGTAPDSPHVAQWVPLLREWFKEIGWLE